MQTGAKLPNRTMIRRGRAGDIKLKGFAVLTETLNTTSIGILEEQCLKRHLKVSYTMVEERPATAMSPHKHFVMEVSKPPKKYVFAQAICPCMFRLALL